MLRDRLTKKSVPLVFAGGFACIGVAVLVFTNAAAPSYSIEAESGSVSGPATKIVDSSASGSGENAIMFNAAPTPTPPPTGACTTNVTTATFASAVSASAAGHVICLASGNYGTWAGTNKAITITAQSGATPLMTFDFTTGDSGFTIDGVSGAGGRILNGAKNITIRNTAFTTSLTIDGVANANILLDKNTHKDIRFPSAGGNVYYCADVPAGAIHLPYSSATHSGVTVQNSLFSGGHKDGIQTGTGINILNNEFYNIKEGNDTCTDWWDTTPHTDPIQIIGGKGAIVRGNWIHDVADGIVAYDGIEGVTIENNVVDIKTGRYGIELYSDKNSIVRNNTLVYGTGCAYLACGQIILSRKTTDPAGSGTIIENNIATAISMQSGSTAATNRNNMLRSGASGQNFNGSPVFVGGSSPTSFLGFLLAAGSPGKSAGADGLDVGIR